jgi:amino acid permease
LGPKILLNNFSWIFPIYCDVLQWEMKFHIHTKQHVNAYIVMIRNIIIYFKCKWVFTLWRWYYNKTQHTNNTHHTKQHTTLKQSRAHKTTQTIKDTLHTMNTVQIQLQLQQIQLQLLIYI